MIIVKNDLLLPGKDDVDDMALLALKWLPAYSPLFK